MIAEALHHPESAEEWRGSTGEISAWPQDKRDHWPMLERLTQAAPANWGHDAVATDRDLPMILADASVVIVYERVPTARLKKIIADAGAVVCGLTVAELFAGVRSAKDESKLRTALADFQSLSITDAVWDYQAQSVPIIGEKHPCYTDPTPLSRGDDCHCERHPALDVRFAFRHGSAKSYRHLALSGTALNAGAMLSRPTLGLPLDP